MARNPSRLWLLGAVCALALMHGAQASAADAAGCKLPAPGSAAALLSDCDAALATANGPADRVQKLFARAYAKNDLEKYEEALADLTQAVALSPNDPTILHELGYTKNALGDYAGALKDLDAELALSPDSLRGFDERYLSHFNLAHFEAAYEDADRVARGRPGDRGALLRRARTALWLGRFAEAKADLDAVVKTSAENDRKPADTFAKTLDAWSTTSAGPSPAANCAMDNNVPQPKPHLIGDCTRAFFDAKTDAKRADALTVRAVAWGTSGDAYSEDTDLTMAVALDPENPDRHANLGFAELSGRHSWAAAREFDKAIAKNPDSFAYLGGRASARMNLGDEAGSFADAKKSFEIKPNEIALLVLGDLLDRRHDVKAAKLYWMGAYQLGMRDDRLIARLKSVGVDDPEAEARAAKSPKP